MSELFGIAKNLSLKKEDAARLHTEKTLAQLPACAVSHITLGRHARLLSSNNEGALQKQSLCGMYGKESTRAIGPSAATTSDGLLARQRRRVRRPRRRRCRTLLQMPFFPSIFAESSDRSPRQERLKDEQVAILQNILSTMVRETGDSRPPAPASVRVSSASRSDDQTAPLQIEDGSKPAIAELRAKSLAEQAWPRLRAEHQAAMVEQAERMRAEHEAALAEQAAKMRAEHEAVMAKRASGEHTSRADHKALLAEQAERLTEERKAALTEQAAKMRAEHEAVMAKRASGEHTSRAKHQALLAEQAERLRGECEAAMAEQAERLRPEHEAALEALRAEHAAALTAKSAAMRNLWGQQARPRSEPCGRRRDDTSLLASVPQVESLRAKDEARASARH